MKSSLILIFVCFFSELFPGVSAEETCPKRCRFKITKLNRRVKALEQSAEENGYQVVFSAKKGSGVDLLDVWKAADTVSENNPDADVYKSPLAEEWGSRGVDLVRIEVLVEGVVKSHFLFDGRSSTKLNWMTKERILGSANGNLAEKSFNFFSMQGDDGHDRHFYINAKYGGCPADAGWLVVVDGGSNPACTWMDKEAKPYFMYCEGDEPCLSDDAPVGDTFRILVKFL